MKLDHEKTLQTWLDLKLEYCGFVLNGNKIKAAKAEKAIRLIESLAAENGIKLVETQDHIETINQLINIGQPPDGFSESPEAFFSHRVPEKKYKGDPANKFLDFLNTIEIRYRKGIKGSEGVIGTDSYGPFIPTQHQLLIIRKFINKFFVEKVPVRTVELKSRQQGFTTTYLALFAWVCAHVRNTQAMIVLDVSSHVGDKRMQVFKWLEHVSEVSTAFPRIISGGHSTKSIYLNNGSSITFIGARDVNPGTSTNPNLLLLSELDKYPAKNYSEIMASLVPAVAKEAGTAIVIESTSTGTGRYRSLYESAKEGKSGFDANFYSMLTTGEYRATLTDEDFDHRGFKWSAERQFGDIDYTKNDGSEISEKEYAKRYGIDEATIKWRREQITLLDNDRSRFNNEFPTTDAHAFDNSVRMFFNQALIDRLLAGEVKKDVSRYRPAYPKESFSPHTVLSYTRVLPRIIQDDGGEIHILSHPVAGEDYYAGLDTSEGIVRDGDSEENSETDFNVLFIMDKKGMPAAMYRSKAKVEAMWYPVISLCMYYNFAWLNAELPKADGLLSYIIGTQYPNLFTRAGDEDYRERVWTRINRSNRPTMLDGLRTTFQVNYKGFWYSPILHEFSQFLVYADGKPRAAPGEHDDIPMAAALADICRQTLLGIDKVKKQEIVADRSEEKPRFQVEIERMLDAGSEKYGKPAKRAHFLVDTRWKPL